MNKGSIFISKFLISIIIMLVVLILVKANSNFKTSFYNTVYESNISFTAVKSLYNKYIGSIDLFDKVVKTEMVFNEKLNYNSKEPYMDGVEIEVNKNYLVPINESGIVVFIGNKEGYGNTIIIQRVDGIDEWYGNIDNVNVNLYDYVKKGEVLGEAKDKFYLVYKKDGNVLDYEEYIN